MAPIKRNAATALHYDSDVDVGGSETDSDQTASRKRRRTSNVEDAEHSTSSSSDEVDYTLPNTFDEADEAEYELLATQAVKEKYAAMKENLAAESGILEQVTVRNFMCHEYLEYDLGPLINFICGKNGSGKSAILTAIVLCLGGRASATNRGQSLKKFIKEGQEQAVISVKIKNQGTGAYLPEIYGRTIHVERHFNRSGASGFKIKSQNGQIRSTKKAELEEICDHFSLQIDNPMNVLSQDNARQFITSSSASEKYKLFVKGVQLEQLDQDYRIIEENLNNIEEKLEAKRDDMKPLEKNMKAAKAKLDLANKQDSIREKINDYRRQLCWVQVEAKEQIRDECIKAIMEADAKIEAAEDKVAEWHDLFEAADRESTEATRVFQNAEEDLKAIQDEKADEKLKHDEIKKEMMDFRAEERSIRTTLEDAKTAMGKKKIEIEQEQRRLRELNGGGAAARLIALEQEQDAVREAAVELQTHRETKPQLEYELENAKQEYLRCDKARVAKNEHVERQKEILNSHIKDRGQRTLAFHPQMPQLLRAIQEERGFSQHPIGPVGKHVRLLKPEWSSILEKSFGNTLGSFIVTTKKDMGLLEGIMKRVRCYCPIIIGNNQALDTSPHEPDQNFDTVLRVLEIDNDLVRKQLVIQHGIEQTILVADPDEASRILYDGSRPRNVKRCYSFHPSNKTLGYMLSFTRSNEPSQDPIGQYTGPSRMNTDVEAQIRLQEEALQDLKDQLQRTEQDSREARDRLEKLKKALVRHSRKEADLVVASQQAEDRVERIKEAIDGDNVEGGKLEVLRAAYSEAEKAKALHEASYEACVIASDAKKEQLLAAGNILVDFDDRIAVLKDKYNKASEIAQKATKKRALALGDKNAAVGRVDDGKRDRDSLQRQREEMDKSLERCIELSRQVSERVNIDEGETYASLLKKHNGLKEMQQRYERQLGGTLEAISAEAARTSQAYHKGKRDLEELENLGKNSNCLCLEEEHAGESFEASFHAAPKPNLHTC